MAEVKIQVRTIGQRISGLAAGTQYVFVLKRPNARVDVMNAERAVELAEEQLSAARKVFAELDRARQNALRGEATAARQQVATAREQMRIINRKAADARDFAERAAGDAKDAPGDLKDAYDAAKDGAAEAITVLDKLLEGGQELFETVGALIAEAELAAPSEEPAAASPDEAA